MLRFSRETTVLFAFGSSIEIRVSFGFSIVREECQTLPKKSGNLSDVCAWAEIPNAVTASAPPKNPANIGRVFFFIEFSFSFICLELRKIC